ncbi:MAG: FAD:protein FMN transferase [Erysipelotrichales bacterium]|nr:FAD:protein FMN transferase [Erysipelotrichales bacterium]
MKKLYLCILALFLVLTGCAKSSLSRFSRPTVTAGFDTSFTLIGFTKDEKEFNDRFEEMNTLLLSCNALFDKYNNYEGLNNLKSVNDNAGIKPVEVDPLLIDLLKTAKEFYDISGGAFDITAGKAMEIWHNYRTAGMSANEKGDLNPAVPSAEELENARVINGWDHVIIDENAKTVYLDDPKVMLDVGGIAKGYACELLAQHYLKDNLMGSGAINGGGNVRILGAKPDGSKWSVGVTAPDSSSAYAGTFYTDGNLSFVTSGDYQRYYVSDGKVYSHIMDPFTLQCAQNVRSVTVVTEDSGIADCLSTALFVLPFEDGRKLIDTYNASHKEQIGAYWVFDDTCKPDFNELISYQGYYVYASENIRDMLDVYGASK